MGRNFVLCLYCRIGLKLFYRKPDIEKYYVAIMFTIAKRVLDTWETNEEIKEGANSIFT